MDSNNDLGCEKASLKLQSFSSPLQFQLPDLDGYLSSEISVADMGEATSLHLRFRLDAEPYTCHEITKRKAAIELKSMIAVFPSILDPMIMAAATAWFYLNCHVDDLIEEMSSDAARAVLKEVPVLLRGPRRGSKQSSDFNKSIPLTRCDSANGISTDEDMAHQIRHVFSCTRRHMQALLPLAVYHDLCPDMIAVFEAMHEETTFRQTRDRDLAKYLAIRVQTIALSPLFKLVRYNVGGEPVAVQHLAQLESSVSLAVGLQNDIIGIDKDLAQGEWMNYPMVYAEGCNSLEKLSMIELGAQKGVEDHNFAVSVVFEQWKIICEKGSREDREVAAAILNVVALHFKWASKAKRYMK